MRYRHTTSFRTVGSTGNSAAYREEVGGARPASGTRRRVAATNWSREIAAPVRCAALPSRWVATIARPTPCNVLPQWVAGRCACNSMDEPRRLAEESSNTTRSACKSSVIDTAKNCTETIPPRGQAFDSPSTAAGVLLGRSTNGRVDWKDAEGRTLKELQTADIGEATS